MKYGIVDIGSNTIRLNIYRVREDQTYIKVANNRFSAGLVNYIKKGHLSNSGIRRLMYILGQIKKIEEFLDLDYIYLFATASLRRLKNRQYVLEIIKEELGYDVDLLSGRDEASLGLEGIRGEYDIKDGVILDIGGGSTELSVVLDGVMKMTESFELGSLSLQKDFVVDIMPNKKEIKTIEKEIRSLIYNSDIPMDLDVETIYGMGGTIRACGNLVQDIYDRSDNKTAYYEDIADLYDKLIRRKKKSLRRVLKIIPSRTHTILPGLAILKEIMEYTEIDTLRISQDGVREGYLNEVLRNGNGQ